MSHDGEELTPEQQEELTALSYKIYCHAIDLVGEDDAVSVQALAGVALALHHAATVMENAVIEITHADLSDE